MTISSAATAAPQAPPAYSATYGRSDGDFATTGFAEALSSASSESQPETSSVASSVPTAPKASPVPPTTQGAPQASLVRPTLSGKTGEDIATVGFAQAMLVTAGSRRNAKDARQQPKERDKGPVTAPVTIALPTVLAPVFPDGQDPRLNLTSESPSDTAKPAANQTANSDSAREVSNPPAPASQPLAANTEMAFAVRVQPALPASAEPGVTQLPSPRENAAVPAQPLLKKTVETGTADETVVQPVTASTGAFLASQGQSFAQPQTAAASTAAPSSAVLAEAPRPVEAKSLETPPKAAAVPLKDISLQVTQAGNQKVEVHLTQQTGEIRVSVHTGDPELAHGLQQGLSDLVGRLQENGSRAEAWRPAGSALQSSPVFESRNSPGGSQKDDSQSYSGGSHQQQDERRQSHSQRPAWVEELENSITGGAQSQGATYGIGS